MCTKFETLVAPSKLFSKLLKLCMMYFITIINKMTDEEVKHLKFDFSWITLMYSPGWDAFLKILNGTPGRAIDWPVVAFCRPTLSFIHSLTHSLTPSTSVGHLWWLSRHAYFPCRSWFQMVFVRCPDTTDQHRSWLVFQHLFYHAQASIALDPTLLAQMILDSAQQIGGVSSWSYHSLWEDPRKAVHSLHVPSS